MRQSRGRGAGTTACARARLAAIAAIATTFALAGCAPLSQTMTDAAAQGRSAVETASLALELEQDGRSIFGLTATAFDDAQRELGDAVATVDEADVSTEADRALRTATADALRDGIDAVNAARESLEGVTDPDEVAEALDEASAQLDALVTAGGG
ncbi:hypothetical protein [Agromyces silvae]|uniref:hypothetical protein n=1 Tax=Agromyces silvae TaxID=3388266 RepID=UPI00280C182D|nr:hypothetical protein [Agromyces protaetiae]